MRVVRLGPEPTKVGTDIRAAITTWGEGTAVLGGLALCGSAPPGFSVPLDAVLVLPRGVVLVVGADLPEPASRLDASLKTPWVVDGWPLVRAHGTVNPGIEAVTSASTLAQELQRASVEPLPVTVIVAVGPFVEQVHQPTSDPHRGVRVVSPSPTSILAATRELATYQCPCSAEAGHRLARVLNARAGDTSIEELADEGFSYAAEPDMSTFDTVAIRRDHVDYAGRAAISQHAPLPSPAAGAPARWLRRVKPAAWIIVAFVLCGVIGLVGMSGQPETSERPTKPTTHVDGVTFTRHAIHHDTQCRKHTFGDFQAALDEASCAGLLRAVFDTEVAGRRAAVSVTTLDLTDSSSAEKLRQRVEIPGAGGVTDLRTDPALDNGGPASFDNAAQTVEQNGKRLRIVRAVWSAGESTPDDVRLRALAERGIRIPDRI